MFKKALNAGWYWFCRGVCRFFCILFFRLRAYGVENIPRKGAFLLVGNHQSYLDPVFCGVPLKKQLCFLARESLFSNWFFGGVLSSVNSIPLKRGEADLSAIKTVIAKLKDGRGVCLYPEGTRTSDGKIAPFKSGLGLLCRRGDAAVVPMVIDGAFECWPRHKKIFSSGLITVCYGKPISAEQAQNMGDEKLTETVTAVLRQMQNTCRVKLGKKPYDYSV